MILLIWGLVSLVVGDIDIDEDVEVGVDIDSDFGSPPRPPQCSSNKKALWSPLDGIWGVLKGSWAVLAYA